MYKYNITYASLEYRSKAYICATIRVREREKPCGKAVSKCSKHYVVCIATLTHTHIHTRSLSLERDLLQLARESCTSASASVEKPAKTIHTLHIYIYIHSVYIDVGRKRIVDHQPDIFLRRILHRMRAWRTRKRERERGRKEVSQEPALF